MSFNLNPTTYLTLNLEEKYLQYHSPRYVDVSFENFQKKTKDSYFSSNLLSFDATYP